MIAQNDCSFVCFTDMNDLDSNTFEVKRYPRINCDPVRCARFFKLLPHLFFPDYEYSIWIDASIVIKKENLRRLVERYLRENDIAMFTHAERDCIYDEGAVCIDSGKDAPTIINAQLNHYRKNGYPRHNGLVNTGVILRRHSAPSIIQVDTDWWNQLVNFSQRDQLSFNYVAWKNGLRWATIEGEIRDSEYFKVTPHANNYSMFQKEYSDRESYLQNRISSLESQIDALNNGLSLRIGRKMPFGKTIRKMMRLHR